MSGWLAVWGLTNGDQRRPYEPYGSGRTLRTIRPMQATQCLELAAGWPFGSGVFRKHFDSCWRRFCSRSINVSSGALCRGYTHRFSRPRCCPTSPSLSKFKSVVRGNRTEFACSFCPISSDEVFLSVSQKCEPKPRTRKSVRVAKALKIFTIKHYR